MILSLIIVNYNTTGHLRKCLESIEKYIEKNITEIIVVDNNSPDRDIENFPLVFNNVRFYFRNVNDGFGSGCNHGANKASGKYFLFVNPDIIFEEDVPGKMAEFMGKNPGIGACSPLFVNFESELVYTYNKFPNFKWEFFEFLGKGNEAEANKLLNVDKIVTGSPDPLFVDWTTGACLMVRSELFKKIEGFDEDYFLYYEDTDLQYRISKLGFKIAVIPDLRVKHFINSSVKNNDGENIYYFHLNRSKMLFFYKHFGFLKRNSLRALMISGILLRMLTLYFRKRYKGKNQKKMKQYLKMLKIYFSDKNGIVNSEL